MFKFSKKTKLILVFLIFVFFSGCLEIQEEKKEFKEIPLGDSIKIANWNLQIFGQSKASDNNLMNFYKEKIDNYDIIFIQEIRDAEGTAFESLCVLLKEYDCNISSRTGRTSSKEQYGIIYKKGIKLEELKDYNPSPENQWERPPIKAEFDINGYYLIAYNIHTKPSDVPNELSALEAIIDVNGNIVILGDLNADCDYYNNEKETHFEEWKWLIKDNEDTTTGNTNCAYDRIIINKEAEEEFISYGIDNQGINKEISDHYLVWAEFSIQEV